MSEHRAIDEYAAFLKYHMHRTHKSLAEGTPEGERAAALWEACGAEEGSGLTTNQLLQRHPGLCDAADVFVLRQQREAREAEVQRAQAKLEVVRGQGAKMEGCSSASSARSAPRSQSA